jgi:hypothetical protein
LNLGPVDFKLNSKLVVDSFPSNKVDVIEFGEINGHHKSLFSSFYSNYNVEFIRRQANKVSRNLVKAVACVASPQILVDIPKCILNT